MRRGYRQTPHGLDDDPRVSRPARELWSVLDDIARTHGTVEATGPWLCERLRCSPGTLRRWRAELVDAGWLRHVPSPGGRGTTSLWEPLGRTRTVTKPAGVVPVDNPTTGGETRSRMSGSDLGNPLTGERVSRGPYKEHAREEVEQGDRRRGPSWCGCCDVTTRHREHGDGRPYRCPECHPLLAPMF